MSALRCRLGSIARQETSSVTPQLDFSSPAYDFGISGGLYLVAVRPKHVSHPRYVDKNLYWSYFKQGLVDQFSRAIDRIDVVVVGGGQ